MRALALTLLVCTTLPVAAWTQSAQSPNPALAPAKVRNLLLEETTIHSGTAGQFDAAQHDYCVAVVKGGAPACLVFSTATFGQSDLYFTLLPFASFIHYDQGKYTDKGLTPDEAKALSARRVPPVASNHESAIALHIDASVLPTITNSAYPLNLFTEYRLHPGTAAAFLEAIRKYELPAAHKSGALEFEVFTTTVGEDTDRVLIATRLKNFAELDQPDAIAAAMTPQERDLFRQAVIVNASSVRTYIMRYRTDISVDPRAPAVK
jgi:hypothetical protein